MYSYGPPHMAVQKQDDQHEHTFSSYVRIRDVVLKTYLGRWTIGRSGERGSGISVLPARYDDDDDETVLMLNWIVLNRTDYLHKIDLALNNLRRLIHHKTQQTKQNQTLRLSHVFLYIYIWFHIPIEIIFRNFFSRYGWTLATAI